MTVQQLIDQLSKFDPQTPVIGSTTDPTDYTFKVSIVSVEPLYIILTCLGEIILGCSVRLKLSSNVVNPFVSLKSPQSF